MARLRITDIDTIKQDCHLLVITPAYTDISLSSNGSSLSHVYAYGILQQIIYTLYRRRLNFLTTQYSYHSRLLTLCQRCPGAHNAHFVQGLSVADSRVSAHLVGTGTHTLCAGMSQRSDTQCTHEHLSA